MNTYESGGDSDDEFIEYVWNLLDVTLVRTYYTF